MSLPAADQLPIVTSPASAQRPYLVDCTAVDEFRRQHKIEPARIRRMRYALFQQHLDPEKALEHLQQPFTSRALESFELSSLSVAERHDSTLDRSCKFVLSANSSGEKIETVLMRSAKRITACVSTQVGCQAGCSFCATARMGLRRNLSMAEIVDQVLIAARTAALKDQDCATSSLWAWASLCTTKTTCMPPLNY